MASTMPPSFQTRLSRAQPTPVAAHSASSPTRQTPMKSITKPKSSTTNPSRKRKIAETYDEYAPSQKVVSSVTHSSPTKSTSKKNKKDPNEEKRLKRYRASPPQSFLQKLERAESQRMIVLSRTRNDTATHPSEEISIVGSTGNIYTVTISQLPSCTCPDSLKGNECKHKVYALATVLKAPFNLQYQLALLKSELDEIFAHAPPTPTDVGADSSKDHNNRKPIDGECPICYMDLDESSNELVWCKAACGNNMHKSCFDQWARSQRGQTVKCVYCRTPWEMEKGDLKSVVQGGEVGEDGYVNVAEQFGLSRARDYTSYHQPWVRRQFGMGW